MDACSLQQGGNELLAILPVASLVRLAPHCQRVHLEMGQVISDANEPISSALFIESGIASIFKPGKPVGVEVCLAGPEAFCGTPLVLEEDTWPYCSIVQSDDFDAVEIEAEAFRQLVAWDADLRRVLLRAVHVRVVQLAEGVISNASQRVIERLARWLLMYRDRLRSDRLVITHEYMAMMVGAQRTGVTAALHELEGLGAIKSRRGLVIIEDLPILLELAAGSYGLPEEQQARLLNSRRLALMAADGAATSIAGR